MGELSKTACTRCREQKARCSRTLPRCTKCDRAGTECKFPLPPDRKLVAAHRHPWGKRQAARIKHESSTSPASRGSASNDDNALGAHQPFDPTTPGALRTVLTEVFFGCFFHSPLMFHRPTFDLALSRGKVPRHTLLAMSAMATNFVDTASLQALQNMLGVPLPADIKTLGKEWALESGSEALRSVDQSVNFTTQTCQLLAFYWFSHGDRMRDAMFGGMAFRLIRAVVASTDTVQSPSAEAELTRRLFWTALMAHTLNSDNYVLGSSEDPFWKSVPLPNDYPQDNKLQGGGSEKHGGGRIQTASVASVMEEMVKACELWGRVREFSARASALTVTEKLDHVHRLDSEVINLMMHMPPHLFFTKSNLETFIKVGLEPMLCMLHTLYHQTRLVLHGSVVPCGPTPDSSDERFAISAQAIIRVANSLSDMADVFFRLEDNPLRLPPFVGYTMFAAATVHVLFIHAEDGLQRTAARKRLATCLRMLGAMMPHWENLKRLWARIHVLYETQMSSRTSVKAGGNSETGATNTDLKTLMAQKPITLHHSDESIATSVLTYCLPGLSQKFEFDSSSRNARDIDMLIQKYTSPERSRDAPKAEVVAHERDEVSVPPYNGTSTFEGPWQIDVSAVEATFPAVAESQYLPFSALHHLTAWEPPLVAPAMVPELDDIQGAFYNPGFDEAWLESFMMGGLANATSTNSVG